MTPLPPGAKSPTAKGKKADDLTLTRTSSRGRAPAARQARQRRNARITEEIDLRENTATAAKFPAPNEHDARGTLSLSPIFVLQMQLGIADGGVQFRVPSFALFCWSSLHRISSNLSVHSEQSIYSRPLRKRSNTNGSVSLLSETPHSCFCSFFDRCIS